MTAAIQGGAVPSNPTAVLLPPTTSQGGGENQDFGKVLQAAVSGPAAGDSPKDLKSAAPVLGPSQAISETRQNKKPASSKETESLTSLVPVAGTAMIGANIALPVLSSGVTDGEAHSSGEKPLPPQASGPVDTCSPAVFPSVAAPAVVARYAIASIPDSQKSALANPTIDPPMPLDARLPESCGTGPGTGAGPTAEQDDGNRGENSNSVVNCDDQFKAEILCSGSAEDPDPTESKSSVPSRVAVQPSNADDGNKNAQTLHGTNREDDRSSQTGFSSQPGSSAQCVTATAPASDLVASVEITSIPISDAHSNTAEPVAPAPSVAAQSHPCSSDSALLKAASSPTPASVNLRDVGTSDGDDGSQNLPSSGVPGAAGNNASPNTTEVKRVAASTKVAADSPTDEGKAIEAEKKHEGDFQRPSDSKNIRDAMLSRESMAAAASPNAAAPETVKEASSSTFHTAAAVLTAANQAPSAGSSPQHKSASPEQIAAQSSGSPLQARDQLAMEAPANSGSDMARILDRVGQSEMRIGMRTTAFGTVEVHTIVRENQVGLTIASEKGDLHSLFSSEVPGLQSTLRQHDLRLEDVRLVQQNAGLGTGTYSDSDRRQQSFPQTFYSSSSELEPAEAESGQASHLTTRTGLDIHA